jgi:hypothetical protein
VVYEVALKPDRADDFDAELDGIVEGTKSDPDFVKGWWYRDDTTGFAVIQVTDEGVAQRWVAEAGIPPEATISLVSAKAYRLERQA